MMLHEGEGGTWDWEECMISEGWKLVCYRCISLL